MRELCVIVAGRSWRIPPLVPRQNRIVIPALLQLGARPLEHYDSLLDTVFAALTRAHPSLDREEFEDWPIPTHELLDALPLISAQTGFMKPALGGSTEKSEAPDFTAIIADFVNFLPGTTPDYWEDALTAEIMNAQYESWRRHPPVAALVAGYLRYKPKPRNEEAVMELLRLFPTGASALPKPFTEGTSE